jgi:hypothetical protein
MSRRCSGFRVSLCQERPCFSPYQSASGALQGILGKTSP